MKEKSAVIINSSAAVSDVLKINTSVCKEFVMENKIGWAVVCVSEFARRFDISVKSAFQYLYFHGGITFLDEYYEAEHLLSFDDAIDDLVLVCKAKGGEL